MLEYRTTCAVQGASAVVGGLVLVLVPAPLLGVLGVAAGPGALLLARLLGGVLVGLGGSLAGARDLPPGPGRTALLAGNAACDVALATVSAFGVASGDLGGLGWVLVALFGVNALSWSALLARGA